MRNHPVDNELGNESRIQPTEIASIAGFCIGADEAALSLHVFREYRRMRGHEISRNTIELMQKLEQYLFNPGVEAGSLGAEAR